MRYPKKVLHWIHSSETLPRNGQFFEKINPVNGTVMSRIARGSIADIEAAVADAVLTFNDWSSTSIVERSDILRKTTILMQEKASEIATIVAFETGKSRKDALGEVKAAVEMGFFVAGEGRRFYGKTSTSAIPHRIALTRRQPVGICGLIIAANTPIANVAWKAFPALLCGNTAVMKPSEDTPYTALWFAQLLQQAGLPVGVFSIVQGLGEEAGAPLVADSRVDLISFTGSVPVGKYIQNIASGRLAKVCLELGGKNPFIVCDDADIEIAVRDAILSAFSNAGQRCASASRIIVFSSVYDTFKEQMVTATKRLKVGSNDDDDLGPVINESQLKQMVAAVERAKEQDAVVLTGGFRLQDDRHKRGFYMAPTILERVDPEWEVSQTELFGPITCLYKVKDFNEAIQRANSSAFGLTSAIHTKNIHRIQEFQNRIRAGVVSVNGPTYGSEPHMPFGGLKNSGTGSREAGTEALDVYSEWQTVYIKHNPERV